jgi:hypothetical protein
VSDDRRDLDRVYAQRFDDRSVAAKQAIWAEICAFLSRWIDPRRPVIDIGCDAGYFIRHVPAVERWATDVRDMSAALPPAVRFIRADGLQLLLHVPEQHFGTVFMSNYLEHLRDSDEVIDQLKVAFAMTAPGGRLVVLQPNIRRTGGAYWDFIDHHVAITDRSLVEAAEIAGFVPTKVIPSFLPYTTKSRLPQHPALVRWYLRIPFAWRFLGGQTLLIAERPLE